jgi:carbonic anhydrase
MSKVLDQVLAANKSYSENFGDKGKLALPPARQFAVLTCMDARLDPAKYAGLAEGDAHVIRNAGGRASDDAIRSLVISYKLLGTREFFVIHHTDCGDRRATDHSAIDPNGAREDPKKARLPSNTPTPSKPGISGTTPSLE